MYNQTKKRGRGATLLMQWAMKDVAWLFSYFSISGSKSKNSYTMSIFSPFRELLVPVWSKWEKSLRMIIHYSNMMNLEFECSPALAGLYAYFTVHFPILLLCIRAGPDPTRKLSPRLLHNKKESLLLAHLPVRWTLNSSSSLMTDASAFACLGR